jgi:hypothetical protein
MSLSENDPDAAVLNERYPKLKRVGQRLEVEAGPFAGQPVIIRRRLADHGGVLFTLRYDDGRIGEQEWID